MKHFNLLKTTLLLCALIVGSLSSWADDILFSDNFNDLTNGNSTSTSGQSTTVSSRTGWTTLTNVYQAGGSIKLGTGKNTGSLKTSNTYNTSGKTCHIKIKVKGWSSVEGDIKVTPTTGTAQTKSYTAIMSSSFEELDFVFTDGGASTAYTIATTAKRAFIDEVTIYTETSSISSLSVLSAPSKTRYEIGETLDMSGFVLDADGAEISAGYSMSIDATPITNGATLSSAGKKSITVSYGGKEVIQNISVGAVTSIAVTTPPTKTSYDTGDSFDATGMVVTASLSTGEVSEPDTWTREVTGYTVDLDDNLVPANTAATITYASKTTTQPITVTDVAVSDVSLKTSTTIEKGKTETLIPTFTPANATNKNVTWESDNTSVATVDEEGVVTAVDAGTANVTVTTNDGSFEATCLVTVVTQKGSLDSPYSVADVIDLNPKSTSTATKSDVYVVGYIVGCCNTSSGALITNTSELNNTNLALADNPNETSKIISVQLSAGDNRTKFNVKDHSYSLGAIQVLVKADVFKYCGIAGLKNIDEMTAISETVAVSNAGFATYASDFGLDFSGLDVKAYKATVSGTTITFGKVTEVPAGEGVLLQGEGTFEVPVKSVDAWAADDNAFVRGTGAAVATGDGPYNYILNKVNGVVGFYKANGQTVAKNRAYLQSTTAAARISLNFDEETTGISEVAKSDVSNKVFDLQGRHIAQPTKGLYIMNGRKVLVK